MAINYQQKQKKNERKKKKRKEKIQLEGKRKIEIELVEATPEESMLMQPGLWTFLSTKETKKLLKTLACELPESRSNNHKDNYEMLRLSIFMIMGGFSSPEDFIEKTSKFERAAYGIEIGVSTFYDWLERIKDSGDVFESAVTEAAKLYLRHQNKDKKSLVIDIDASYRESKTLWCNWDYKGDHSFRIMFTHASKEKRGAKAILKVSVDPGNTPPQKDLPEIVEELAEKYALDFIRMDSAGYNHKITNLLDKKGVPWLIGGDRDESTLATIGTINPKSFTKYTTNDGIVSDDLIAMTGHAMNKSDQGFALVVKKALISSKNAVQSTLFDMTGTTYKILPLAVSSKLAEGKTAEELRQLYELRGGQEASISQFKQLYEVKAKESREKTEVWVRLLALSYNLSLYFMRNYAQKKTLTLPDIFTPAYRLFPAGL
jgi:hypothetical protein